MIARPFKLQFSGAPASGHPDFVNFPLGCVKVGSHSPDTAVHPLLDAGLAAASPVVVVPLATVPATVAPLPSPTYYYMNPAKGEQLAEDTQSPTTDFPGYLLPQNCLLGPEHLGKVYCCPGLSLGHQRSTSII